LELSREVLKNIIKHMANLVRLELKAIWGKNFLGLAIDQNIGTCQLPVTAYYFWPRTEAWEQLRLELELKPWIQEEEKIKILNSAAKLMNFCMQEYRNTESIETVKKRFKEITFSQFKN
jgi:30S ribosomal protein 3